MAVTGRPAVRIRALRRTVNEPTQRGLSCHSLNLAQSLLSDRTSPQTVLFWEAVDVGSELYLPIFCNTANVRLFETNRKQMKCFSLL